jgi:branched-subunit amino acid transport protein
VSELWIAVIGASAICFLLKLLGYSLPTSLLNNPRLQRINALIPVVLLSALVATQTFTKESEVVIDHRAAGVFVAAIALKMRASFPIMMLTAAFVSALLYRTF